MNALINLKDCREYMTITLNDKDHQIKLLGTIDNPYFCGKDVCNVLGYANVKDALQRHVESDDKTTISELNYVGRAAQPTLLGPPEHIILTIMKGKPFTLMNLDYIH